jgi:hypothetical protein
MMALPSEIGYIHEPLRLGRRPGLCAAPVQVWFPYINEHNEEEFLEPVSDTLRFSYAVGAEMAAIANVKDTLRMSRDLLRYTWHQLRGSRPLVKDPLALLSAEWLASRFEMEVLVLIRHPAGFASSLKKWKLTHPFIHFLQQEQLMADKLAPFADLIQDFVRKERSIMDQAGLLWTILYSVVEQYRRDHPDWLFVRYEDLAAQPVDGFARIHRQFGLAFDERIAAQITRHSIAGRQQNSRGAIRRDSRLAAASWRERLSDDEIAVVRAWTSGISTAFYQDHEW